MQRYVVAIKYGDEPVLNSIKKSETPILENKNIGENSNVQLQSAYEVRNIAGSFFFVHALLDNKEDIYCLINIDYTNNTFAIQSLEKTVFEEIENGVVKDEYQNYLPIPKEQYNKFQ